MSRRRSTIIGPATPSAAVVVARDRADAVAGLRALADGRPEPGVLECRDGFTGPGTVFVYSGQGSQWAGMGRQLLVDEPAFATAIDELEPDFLAQTGFSLRQTLADGVEVVGIDRIQPVLVGIQLALTALWRSYGVTPDAVIGHSMGEVSAAVVAGALTPADGLRVIATRSRLMAQLAGQGAMALLELDADAAATLIADYPQVTLAVHASPTPIGDRRPARIGGRGDRGGGRPESAGPAHRRRRGLPPPDHRPGAAAIAYRPRGFRAAADDDPDDQHAPAKQPPPVLDADYWAANLRNPVRFHQAITTARPDTTPSSRSARTRCSPMPSTTRSATRRTGPS